MKEQKIELQNIDSFCLKDIFECGQCFRWNKQEDGSYEGIFGKNILNLKQEKQTVQIKGLCEGDIRRSYRRIF